MVLVNRGGTPGENQYGPSLSFNRINTNRRGAAISFVQTTDGGAQGGLAFFTKSSETVANSGVAERLRIDHRGQVGIGTQTPLSRLHVKGGVTSAGGVVSNNQIVLSAGDSLAYAGTLSWGKKVGDGTYYALALDAKTNNIASDILLAPSGGKVGIGTDDPKSKLEVSGTSNNAKIHIKRTDNGASTFNGSGAGLLLTAAGMNTTSKFTPAIQFGSTDDDFTTTNPKVFAAINGIAAQTYNSDNNGGMHLAFYTTPFDPGANQSTEERVRITSAGNVGIGTVGPQAKLHVNGDIICDNIISNNTVNVKSFGAVGDGLEDDTAAIQDALNTDATGVYFPPGRYRVRSNAAPEPHSSTHKFCRWS